VFLLDKNHIQTRVQKLCTRPNKESFWSLIQRSFCLRWKR
jgi:hypothetical protein